VRRKSYQEIIRSDPDFPRIVAALNDERCPDCSKPGLVGGLRRALSREMFCGACGSVFSVAPFHFNRPPHQFHIVKRLVRDR
jgi:hypothetical protein